MQKMIHSNIEINASCEKIWNILLDFNSYTEWNPFIKKINGEAKKGSRLNISIHLPESDPKEFKPVINVVWEKRQFSWLGRSGFPWLFSGEHMFILEELDPDKTRFHQNEVFRGFGVRMVGDLLDQTQDCFRNMNQAIKERAESEP
ncbi:SRPBCC family protein [candidate division KSB1 bacterium]